MRRYLLECLLVWIKKIVAVERKGDCIHTLYVRILNNEYNPSSKKISCTIMNKCSLKRTFIHDIMKRGIHSMRLLLFYIAILNLIDATLTMYGLHFDYITESNPLMNNLYFSSPWLFLVLKGGLSVTLFILLYKLKPDKRSSNVLFSVSVIAAVSYSFTCLMHGYWLMKII
jgi:hypothetical protein